MLLLSSQAITGSGGSQPETAGSFFAVTRDTRRCQAMPDDLFKFLESVHDEESFLVFLSALALDKADENAREQGNPSPPFCPGANGWENGRIDTFLNAAVAWARASMHGTSFGYQPPASPWRRC